MIKSIIAVSIAFFTFSTPLESYAQEPDMLKPAGNGQAAESIRSGQSAAASSAGEHASAKRADRDTAVIPLANLFPSRAPAAKPAMNSDAVIPPATPPRREIPGLQHEFHGNLTTLFGIANGVPN